MTIGGENKGGSVFSWADEVEKEEAAAASDRAQQQQRQRQKKPNPFGSARPREVVLLDKGIDWTQHDLHLHPPSPSLNGFHQNEKLPRQSNRQLVTMSSHPQVTLSPQIRSPVLCAPPLRYPPKYVAGILYEHWVSNVPNASYHLRSRIEKGNGSPGGGKHESTMKRTGNEFVGKILEGKENFHGRNSHGLPLVNQNIGTPEMHGKRMPLSVNGIRRQPTNIQDDSGMDRIDGATEQKWQKVTKKRQDLSIKQVNNVHQKKKFEKKGIKLQT